jgi:hypothetical protein
MPKGARRDFLMAASGLAAAGLFGPQSARGEPKPEVTRIRLTHFPVICTVPKYLAEALLRLEGFSEIQYVDLTVLPLALNCNSPAVFSRSGSLGAAMVRGGNQNGSE